jgi:hypothetical protein
MNELIAAAILQRRRLQFTYNGQLRIVEPQCYGVGHTGTELLRAHQVHGGPALEPLFEVPRMSGLHAERNLRPPWPELPQERFGDAGDLLPALAGLIAARPAALP